MALRALRKGRLLMYLHAMSTAAARTAISAPAFAVAGLRALTLSLLLGLIGDRRVR